MFSKLVNGVYNRTMKSRQKIVPLRSVNRTRKYNTLITPPSLNSTFIKNDGEFYGVVTVDNLQILYEMQEMNRYLFITDKKELKNLYIDVVNHIKEQQNKICVDIDQEYALQSIKNCDIFIVLQLKNRIIGFVTMLVDIDNLNVDVICSSLLFKGGGQKLMNMIEQIAKKLNKKSIRLKSISVLRTVRFYLKNGFLVDKNKELTYRDTDLIAMYKNI